MAGGEVFGTTEDGQPVRRFAIAGGGLTANIISWGAVVQDLRLAGHDAPLVLGFDRFEDYRSRHRPISARSSAVMPTASAMAVSRIDGSRYQIDRNFLGKHTLHGGSQGFSRRPWTVSLHGRDFVTLALHDPDGAMGFPGALDVTCTYRLKIPGTLSVELTATCDEPTLCNLAQHSYFNLDDGGGGDILDHRLMLNAGAYLPVDADMIPTGVVQPVDGTPFDFRQARADAHGDRRRTARLRPQFLPCSGARAAAGRRHGCRARRPASRWRSGRPSPASSSIPASTSPPTAAGSAGGATRPMPGFCLEPQIWPDSPNRPYFPQATLWPGEIYRQVTEYRFRMP